MPGRHSDTARFSGDESSSISRAHNHLLGLLVKICSDQFTLLPNSKQKSVSTLTVLASPGRQARIDSRGASSKNPVPCSGAHDNHLPPGGWAKSIGSIFARPDRNPIPWSVRALQRRVRWQGVPRGRSYLRDVARRLGICEVMTASFAISAP